MPRRVLPYIWGPPPPLSLIAVVLCFGVSLVGFGNADRIVSSLSRAGGALPGIVIETRETRAAEATQPTYITKVAFRDDAGQVQIREAQPVPFRPNPDQPVRVLWQDGDAQVQVDLPIMRGPVTSVVLTLFNAAGLMLWGLACWLLIRRMRLRLTGIARLGQAVEDE